MVIFVLVMVILGQRVIYTGFLLEDFFLGAKICLPIKSQLGKLVTIHTE